MLFQRLMVAKPPEGSEAPECSREEFRALMIVSARTAPSQGMDASGLRMSELAATLGVPLSTATHTVDRLVAKDLVARRRSPTDRRVVEVALSGRGSQLKELFHRERLAMAHSWLEPLSSAERTHFLELMAKIATLAKPARRRTKGLKQ